MPETRTENRSARKPAAHFYGLALLRRTASRTAPLTRSLSYGYSLYAAQPRGGSVQPHIMPYNQ